MKLSIKQFCKHHGITQKEFAEKIGWNAKSLSQALKSHSPKFLFKFSEKDYFPGWSIGYDFEINEHFFSNESESSESGFVGGYDCFDFTKEFLLVDNNFFNHKPYAFSCIAAVPNNPLQVYEDGKYLWIGDPNTASNFAGFPVDDFKEFIKFIRQKSE